MPSNMRSAQGSNIPATAFGPAPTSMGELTPPGLISYPAVPPGPITDDTPISRSGPGGLSSGKMGAYNP